MKASVGTWTVPRFRIFLPGPAKGTFAGAPI